MKIKDNFKQNQINKILFSRIKFCCILILKKDRCFKFFLRFTLATGQVKLFFFEGGDTPNLQKNPSDFFSS